MWQYIRRKAFDELPGDPDCDPSYVLWWHRHGPFKRAVLRQVVELVHYFSNDQHRASNEQRRPSTSIDASSNDELVLSHSPELRRSSISKKFGKWKTREEDQDDKKRAGGSTQLFVSTHYPRQLREDLINAFDYHLKDCFTDEVSALAGRAVPLLCLYGRDVQQGADSAVQKDFFEEQSLLALTQMYFEQRKASKRERQGDGVPTESLSNLPEGSAKQRALRTITKHVRSKRNCNPVPTSPSSKKLQAEWEAARAELEGARFFAGQAVLLYSGRFKFSYFMDRSYQKIHGFSEPIWDLWPQDVMLQRVAAKEALKKLASNQIRPRASSAPAAAVTPAVKKLASNQIRPRSSSESTAAVAPAAEPLPTAVVPPAAPGNTAVRPRTGPGSTSVRV